MKCGDKSIVFSSLIFFREAPGFQSFEVIQALSEAAVSTY